VFYICRRYTHNAHNFKCHLTFKDINEPQRRILALKTRESVSTEKNITRVLGQKQSYPATRNADSKRERNIAPTHS
jgi:hypothetical protein